jgi:hypothetical protein
VWRSVVVLEVLRPDDEDAECYTPSVASVPVRGQCQRAVGRVVLSAEPSMVCNAVYCAANRHW